MTLFCPKCRIADDRWQRKEPVEVDGQQRDIWKHRPCGYRRAINVRGIITATA